MTVYLPHYRVAVDPEQRYELGDGRILQEVTLVLVDVWQEDGSPGHEPVAVTLAPPQARKLAARLLAAAAQAEHESSSRQGDSRS